MNDPAARENVHIARMELGDVPQVTEIDRLSFPMPWTGSSYQYELTHNRAAHFLVAVHPAPAARPGLLHRLPGPLARLFAQDVRRSVIGFGGFWLVVDEAHIGTLAVHPAWRRRGLGAQLLAAMLQQALALGAMLATLEVRASNAAAQRLYRKFGFAEVGRRKGYYRNNQEDAVLMTVHMHRAHRLHHLEGNISLIGQVNE